MSDTPPADPIFDSLATAALAEDFLPNNIGIGFDGDQHSIVLRSGPVTLAHHLTAGWTPEQVEEAAERIVGSMRERLGRDEDHRPRGRAGGTLMS